VGFEKDYLQADGRRSDIQDYEIKVFELSANGFSTREIAEKIGVSHTTVNRTLKKGEQLKL
jgi:IS30 family transposase